MVEGNAKIETTIDPVQIVKTYYSNRLYFNHRSHVRHRYVYQYTNGEFCCQVSSCPHFVSNKCRLSLVTIERNPEQRGVPVHNGEFCCQVSSCSHFVSNKCRLSVTIERNPEQRGITVVEA